MPDNLAIPSVPQTITVHLGPPDSGAQNVTVPFAEYVKNVASSEIYPTWDYNALHANILAIISFALNRVYTEYYPAQGKNFDITNSTAIDQKFIYGRTIFENIDRLVDEIFNDYIRRIGYIEPLAAKFCNGTTVTCDGLSQWGSEYLAQQGYSYLNILYNYYGYNIELVIDAPIKNTRDSYPGYPLSVGSSGAYVSQIQTMLNRISTNYPLIPKINPVDGIFGSQTERAVRTFQQIFNLTQDGIVGKATWYRMVALYTGILRLSELNSMGQQFFGFSLQYPDAVSLGDEGGKVYITQYFLAMISEYNSAVPPIAVDGIFGTATLNAVKAFQQYYGLPVTGIVDEKTWDEMYNVFQGIIISEINNHSLIEITTVPFTAPLRQGSAGKEVLELQRMLNYVYIVFKDTDPVRPTGTYDAETEASVRKFQQSAGLPVTGVTDLQTWNALAARYKDAISASLTHPVQYPGKIMQSGDRDTQAGVVGI